MQCVKLPAAEVSYRGARRAASFQASPWSAFSLTPEAPHHISRGQAGSWKYLIACLITQSIYQDASTFIDGRPDGLFRLHPLRRDSGPAAVRLPLGTTHTATAPCFNDTNSHRANSTHPKTSYAAKKSPSHPRPRQTSRNVYR